MKNDKNIVEGSIKATKKSLGRLKYCLTNFISIPLNMEL